MGRERRDSAIHTAYDEWDQPEVAVPERNLLRAVLLNAIADLRRPGEYQRKATEFFTSREEDYIFSFHSICGYLNIDPGQVLMVVGLHPNAPFEVVATDDVPPEDKEEPESGE